MTETVLNNELRLQYSEWFRVLSEEERSRMKMLEDGQGICLSDPDRHILVSIGWKQPPKLALVMLNSRDLAKNAEKQISKAMQPYGHTAKGGRQRQIAGTEAYGFGYEYTAQGIPMYAESFTMKKKRTVYYFHFYARTELKDESLAVWNELLDGITEK
jgi:hypothetical protein